MKNFKLNIAYLAIFAMIFTSCSKEEANQVDPGDTATLSFAPLLDNLANARAALKQQTSGIPECSSEDPASVEIILSLDGTAVVGTTGEPFEIQLVDGQLFTEEVAELELSPDVYTLDHFAVLDADGNVLWVAPRTGGTLANFVDNPLPLTINLGAGVKKYVDVTVLCFDNREVNEYGYLFFELNREEAVEFCFFANYCPPDGDGRHYTARYMVSIWKGTNANGNPIYTDDVNATAQYENGDFYASPLCFVLPDNDDLNEPYLYYEVTLLDWAGNYGSVAAGTVISGTLTAQDIRDNFDGEDNVNFEHLRFGCEEVECPGVPAPGDADGDCIPDGQDPCPQVPSNMDMDGDCIPDGSDPCPAVHTDNDMDGDCIPDGQDNCPETSNRDQEDEDEDGVGDACDNCPENSNANQTDSDGDGIGNACEENNGNGGCETAIMFGDTELNDLPGVPANRWGWVEHFEADDDELEDGDYEFDLYAGAGQNDPSRGYLAGVVTIIIEGNNVDVQLDLEDGVSIDDVHIYFDNDEAPETAAFGQWTTSLDGDDISEGVTIASYERNGDFWIGFHSGETCN